jgi:putative ABC transport system permease protein
VSTIPDIGPWQLALCLAFILTAGITSLVYALGLGRDLLVGTIRTVAQLLALGYLLKLIFDVQIVWLVLGLFAAMILFAAQIIRGRVQERSIPFFWPIFGSMLVSYALVSFVVVAAVVGARPWWDPRFFIPMAGMVVGNSMNAIALSLDRLTSDLRKRRGEVELMLCLGADYREASRETVHDAMRAGMIPSINAMMAAGVVYIPGMMTGQLLAGADPLLAARYQIVVMLMLVGSSAIGALLVTLLVRRRCFGPGQQLLLRPQK